MSGTKEVTVKLGGAFDGKTVAEEISERNAAIEAAREKREQPRVDYMKSGKGKASDFFEIQSYQPKIGESTVKTSEELTDEERDHWLATGDLPERKKEKKGQADKPKPEDFRKESGEPDEAAFERAFREWDAEQRAKQEDAVNEGGEEREETERAAHIENISEISEEESKAILDEVRKRSETWHSEPEHAEAMKTFPQRWQAMEQSLTAEQKAIVESSKKVIGQKIRGDLNRFILNALARTKNMGAVYVELMREPGLLQQMNQHWEQSANWAKDPVARKLRTDTDVIIRAMLEQFDRRAAKASGAKQQPKRQERQLTRAGRPPLESTGSHSSPKDDGSAEAAWGRKDLSREQKGELYRERKNAEERAARERKYPRRRR
jgi:hypothetical protein